jgi:hypothetical protein
MAKPKTLLLSVVMASLLAGCVLAPQAGAKSYFNLSDINCPYWNVREPFTGYGLIGTTAGELCVSEYSGTVVGGGKFSESRGPLIAALNLWRYSGGRYTVAATTSTLLKVCGSHPVNFSLYIAHVSEAYLCGTSQDMLAHTGVKPPHGCYHGELIVRVLEGGQTVADVNSDARCY